MPLDDRQRPSPTGGAWAFHPRSGTYASREDREGFRRRLETAIQAGRGLGTRFSVRLDSGPEPTLRIGVDSSESHRWLVRTLAAAYERDTWRPDRRSWPAPASVAWGRRMRPWPRPLRDAEERTSLLDVWARTFSVLPRGLSLEVELHPLSPRTEAWWERLLRVEGPTAPARPARARTLPSRDGTPAAGPALATPPAAPGWLARISLGSVARSPDAPSLVEAARRVEHASRSVNSNGIAFGVGRRLLGPTSRGFLLSELEVALFLPVPDSPLGGPDLFAPARGWRLPLGRTELGSVIGPAIEPHEGRHLVVLGETGMGKSSLLVAVARRVCRRHGLILLDPLGATSKAIARELSAAVQDRLLLISPLEAPRRVNALDGASAVRPEDRVRAERRLHDLVHSLQRVRSGRYASSAYWGPRLEEMLTAALSAAASTPRGTLSDAHTLLATGGRLHREIPSAAMGPVRELAQRIRERPDDAEGARRLLHEIVRSHVLETMLCAPEPDLRPSELVQPGRIVLISGAAREVGETVSRYLLSVYLALVWSEVLSRPTPAKTFLLLDEAHWFAHESLAEMLRMGRSANLHVVLATQSVASLHEPVTDAVWTNVADFVCFRGAPDLALELARSFRGISPEGLLSLPRGRAAVLLGKGEALYWARTLHLPAVPSTSPEGMPRASDPAATHADPVPGAIGPGDGTSRDEGSCASAMVPTRPARVLPIAERGRGTPQAVIDLLRAQGSSVPPGELLRVELAELRRRLDPGGTAVRRAGSQLSAVGAIVSVERTDAGTVWMLDPGRIPPAEGLPPNAEGDPPPSRSTPSG